MFRLRLARDHETLPARFEAVIRLAMVDLIAHRLTGEATVSWRDPRGWPAAVIRAVCDMATRHSRMPLRVRGRCPVPKRRWNRNGIGGLQVCSNTS